MSSRRAWTKKLYERAMIIELNHRDTVFQWQSSFPRFLSRRTNRQSYPDLIFDNSVIVDPKVFSCFTDTLCSPNTGI